MGTANLLVELNVEELPPKALRRLGEAFAGALADGLRAQGLAGADCVVTPFASPRRLAAHLTAVAARAADRALTQKLMPVAVGLDAAGNATPALLKKLAALGADAGAVPRLKRAPDGKAEALFLDSTVAGATLAAGLQTALDQALARLPIPKVMSYQLADGWQSVHFVRPAHRLIALHGADVVPVTALGLAAGRETQGHRFEAAADPVVIRDADSYAAQLEAEGAVIASFAARRAEIERQIHAAAAAAGLAPVDDDALVDEVTALVERPNVLLGRFEEAFLGVPQECLILTMKANQKYFPLLDGNGRLTNRFLIVSNIRPADPQAVIGGNERVVRPRLADAKFFFDQDRRQRLEARLPALARVVYHNKLGTQGERSARVEAIARAIGERLDGGALAEAAAAAARLAKADLVTDMVGEFPELQGIMGAYYARHDGIAGEIADAIEDHYRPRFAGDALPRNPVGIVVALADKLETLTGLIGIGERPSGDRDPFALRRHALGVVRMLVERELAIGLTEIVDIAAGITCNAAVRGNPAETGAQVVAFIHDRLANQLRDQGYSAQEVDAVLAQRPERIREVPRLLEAVRAFTRMAEAAPLAAANKRVGNILKKAAAPVAAAVDQALLVEPAERQLHAELERVAPLSARAFAAGDYTGSLRVLASLKAPVDAFFDSVMVNAEDAALRANRLGLLMHLSATMNRAADLSRLAA
ncbi:MAG: glycine--tRNA ligase subunit beta [Burkholderiales bacterium]|nr:glycine--tRNA ligase subunit beta [Burkholderiales bacterium]